MYSDRVSKRPRLHLDLSDGWEQRMAALQEVRARNQPKPIYAEHTPAATSGDSPVSTAVARRPASLCERLWALLFG